MGHKLQLLHESLSYQLTYLHTLTLHLSASLHVQSGALLPALALMVFSKNTGLKCHNMQQYLSTCHSTGGTREIDCCVLGN